MKKKTKKTSKKTKYFSTGKVGYFVLLVILLMGMGGLLISGGISFPNFSRSQSQDQGTEYIPIPITPAKGDRTLQLNPIKFKACTGTSALDFLLDRSGSMQGTKIAKLKQAVLAFSAKLSDDSIIGIQDFSSPSHPAGTVKVLVPFSYYKDVKNSITNLVNSMNATGYTHTKEAFMFTDQRLDEAIPKFPSQYKFVLIFISDGVPETASGTLNASGQMPDQIVPIIKSKGIRIFTIIYGQEVPGAQVLMDQIASSPSDAYSAPNPDQIDSILNQIATKLCNEP